MKKSGFLIILISVIILLVICDILIRLRYCSNSVLQFDSTEFNNILTPIISFFGFIAVIITISITVGQRKSSESEYYFKDYRIKIQLLEKEKGTTGTWTNHSLINFVNSIQSDVDYILANDEYISDLESYRKGLETFSQNKLYDKKLGTIRLFHLEARLLYKSILNLIKEIEQHDYLTKTHKALLLNHIVERLISEYLANCQLVKGKLKNWEEDLYIGFLGTNTGIYDFKMFTQEFYELFDYIFKGELRKYYQ